MATYIKTLLEYSTGDTIYPKTKSDAVYRTDNVTVAETTLAAADTHIANTNNPHNVTATQLNVYTKTEIDNAGYLTSIPKASSSVLGGIKIGSGLTISSGGVVSVTGGGVADSVAWGHITGTLADQTDLNNILGTIPTNVSDLPNDAGYITGITSSDVTNALGYTPYSSANPNGYTSNIGTITSVKTTAGTHNTINVTSGSVSFNVPTKTSHLNNDSGFITTETDPVFSASAAASINASDITNWNNKTSNVGTITGVSINSTSIATSGVANITSIPLSIISDASDLKAIEAISSNNGLLKKTAANKWSLDTSTYATESYVDTAIENLPEPMIFKGSLGTGGTITSLPTASSTNTGFTYKVITSGTYASQSAKVGDTFISDGSAWVLIPSGDEPSGTVTSITIKANSPISVDSTSAITSSGTRTISHSTSGVTAGTYNNVTVNTYGHVTSGSNVSYLTSETDPVFSASAAAGITSSDITNWNTKSFKITVTENNGTYTADKTYAEVESAINAGYICYISDEPYYYYYTMYLPGEGYYFEITSVTGYRIYFCYMSDGTLFQASEPIIPSFSATSPIAVMGSSTVTYYLQDNYGDTKNPYASKTKNYVLAAPSTANGAPSFRALVATDIPTLTISKISDFPTNVSSFTNDAGYLTSDATWNGVSLTKSSSAGYSGYVPFMSDTTSTSMSLRQMSDSPSSGRIAVYNSSNYLITTTPTAGDNSTKAATTAFVATAISGKADSATTLAGYGITDAKIESGTITLGSNTITPSTTDEKLKAASAYNNTTYYPIFGTSTSDAETKFKDTIGFKYITKSTGEAMITLGNGTSGASNSRYGVLELYGTTTYSTILTSGAPTAARTISLPNKSGTIALTDDIPDISNKADKATTLAGYGITDAKISNGTITLGSNTITPLTSFTEADPIFSASAAAGITSNDITNWNNKVSSSTTAKIFVQSATPTGMSAGDIWIDTTGL